MLADTLITGTTVHPLLPPPPPPPAGSSTYGFSLALSHNARLIGRRGDGVSLMGEGLGEALGDTWRDVVSCLGEIPEAREGGGGERDLPLETESTSRNNGLEAYKN